MCLEFLTCWCLCTSKLRCCFCFKHETSLKMIPFYDLIEAVVNAGLLYLIYSNRDTYMGI